MEDLLNKNIFNDKDLCKLSPDYSPSNILLRMQIRRTMVKDSHSHGTKSTILEGKTIKRARDCYKINKEITKIRNGYQKINLKNQVILKNAIKYIDGLKVHQSQHEYNDALEICSDPDLDEICVDKGDLVINNDMDFKIHSKPKTNKLMKGIKKPKMNHNNILNQNGDFAIKRESSYEDVLRVECTYHNRIEYNVKENFTHSVANFTHNEEIDYDLPTSRFSLDNNVNDLQSLLIMMAISPKPNENEDKTICDSTPFITDEVNELNFIPPTIVKTEEITDFLNVIPMRIEINDKQKYILHKYVEKWKMYVKKKKDCILQQRQATLNSFFDKLEKKKTNVLRKPSEPSDRAKMLVHDFNSYQHRYKVQKHIIALQKAKLDEQNRMIEELKYNKIVEASRQSVEAMRDEVRKTYFEIDRHLKPKIKCLTNELKIPEIDESTLVLQCLKVPQFLQRMEKRAREREEKHAMIRERRRQMEEERIRLKQQAELAKAEMDKEEKTKRIKELRDKRKREKIENIRRKQYAERMRALTVMADINYEKILMVKYGIRPLRLLIEIKHDNLEKARAHYKFQLKKNIFLNWMWFTEDMWFERNYKADYFSRKKLLTRGLECFKQNHYMYVLKKQVAEDYYDLYVTHIVFKKFCDGIQQLRKEQELKWQNVVKYHNSNLLFKAFTCWRTLPALNALKREQEVRKARWREKVLQVVPDYTPPDD